jgi:hypothetical protein
MSTNKIELDTKGIKRALKSFTAYESIAEYIWNGFDAEATEVRIDFVKGNLGNIEEIFIRDNGYGIRKDTLLEKFTPIFESNKALDMKKLYNSSIVHGKNGVGRFTFFTFCDRAKWMTVYKRNGRNYTYNIEIDANSLNKYSDSDEVETGEAEGTIVHFLNFDARDFVYKDLYEFFILEFAWYLELNKEVGKRIFINGELFEYNQALHSRSNRIFQYEDKITTVVFDVTICCWNLKLHEEYSKYYYINSYGKEVYKENTTLNNKGDKFYHSVFIKSVIFDDFIFEKEENQVALFSYSKDSPEFKYIRATVDKYLKEIRNPFIMEYSKKYVLDLKKSGAYPELSKTNIVDRLREETLDEMISAINLIEPKIFSGLNNAQQKTLVRLLDFSMRTGDIDSLYFILDNILDMEETDRKELARILKFTTMTNITKTIELIKDRLIAISHLKKLVLDKDLYANEIDHLQPFIEKHYWIFGEQYYLVTAEEPDFEEALRRFIYILRGEKKQKGTIKISDPNKQKEMDIFAVQRKLDGQIKKCIVVELKSPEKVLSMRQLQQVKDYFGIILREDRFNSKEIEWEFYLVGNKYNDEIGAEIESHKNIGERSLVHSVHNMKIFVKTWSDIFTEHEINLKFIQEKLLLQHDKILKENPINLADEIVKIQERSSAKRPSEIAVI